MVHIDFTTICFTFPVFNVFVFANNFRNFDLTEIMFHKACSPGISKSYRDAGEGEREGASAPPALS